MKLTSRVLLVADAAARFWVAHWLLIVGGVLIFASALLKWVYFAFSRHPLGLQLPLLRNIGLIPHFSLFSYGVVGIAILTIGLVLRLAFRLIPRTRGGRHARCVMGDSSMPDCFSATGFAWPARC